MASKNSFEASLKELEEITARLESSDISLEESIELFKKGMVLSKECSAMLDNAKQEIISLTEAESEVSDDD